MSDAQLLREYADRGVEAAFAEIVHRHTNLVYSAALRQVDSPEAAAEITQNVFVGLARGAQALSARLTGDASLAGWLCRSARNQALNFRRDEFRRHSRERLAMELLNPTSETAPDWERLRPVLDEAMAELHEADYDALVLRYFKNHDLRAVGQSLGVSDDTAQKRVSRALDKLREHLARRGVATTAAALSVVITANAVQAAPVGLAVTISTAAALAGTTLTTATTATAIKTIAMTTLQKTLIAATVAMLAGAGIYEARQAAQLRDQNEILQQQQAPLAGQIRQLQQERDLATASQAATQQENERLQKAVADVPRLRGELARLRTTAQPPAPSKTAGLDANDPATQSFLAAKGKAEQISRYLQQMPDKAIPEFSLLTDVDWLSATKEAKFDTDADIRKTLSTVRGLAKKRMPLGRALSAFIRANDGRLPSEMAQLKPFFLSALGDTKLDEASLNAILGRYKLLQTGNVSDFPQDAWFIAEKAPVDKDYDSRAKFGNGTSTVIDTGIGTTGHPEDNSY